MSIANLYKKTYNQLVEDLDYELGQIPEDRSTKKIKELLALIQHCDEKMTRGDTTDDAEKYFAEFMKYATPNQKARLYEVIDEIEAQNKSR